MNKRYIWFVLIFAAFLRLFYFSGHIFSDDSYYLELTRLLFSEGFSKYVGYPIDLIRIIPVVLTAVIRLISPASEYLSVVVPFFASLFGMLATWKIANRLFDEKTASIAFLIHAIFPVDIIFSTILFVDIIYSAFFYWGAYYLLKSYLNSESRPAIYGGLLFSAAFLTKSSAIIPISVTLLIAWFLMVNRKKNSRFILVTYAVFAAVLILESLIYYFLNGDFLYRLTINSENLAFVRYDFFPLNIEGYQSKSYLALIAEQWFSNVKYIFLRRFYIFIPLAAFVVSILKYRKEQLNIVHVFYGLLVIAFTVFTISFTQYLPISLRNNWYLIPLFTPTYIIIANYISVINKGKLIIIFVLLMISSIVSVNMYRQYFDVDSKNRFKAKVSVLEGKIYADHHTIHGTRMFLNESGVPKLISNIAELNKGDWLIYSKKKTDELLKQGYIYPKPVFYEQYTFVEEIGEFRIYRVE